MTDLSCQNLCWHISQRLILDHINLSIKPGQFVGLIGPNGSGKTSLLSLLGGLRKPSSGSVKMNGKNIQQISRRHLARQLAFVSQHNQALEQIDVAYIVNLGRTPYLSPFEPQTNEDDRIIQQSLDLVGLSGFEKRKWTSLSGGEQQRVQLARALAQQPSILLLDEPTNHLDIHHQLNLLNLVSQLGLTIVAALHDLNHAAMFCDRIVILQNGQIKADNIPESVLTRTHIQDIFCTDSIIEKQSDTPCHIRYQRPSLSYKSNQFKV